MNNNTVRRIITVAFMTLTFQTVAECRPGHADAISDFYAAKRITLIVPTGAGGGYDVPARALARHFSDHLPGHPSIVVENMPGAGGKRAINYVYNVAPRDGTIVSAVHAFIAFDPLFEGAASQAHFDAQKFNWLGSITSTTSVAVAWHTAKVKTYSDLFATQLVVGGVGTTTPMVTNPTLLRGLLGMKFKVVVGYLTGGDVDLAMERGEVEGRIDYTWFGLKQARSDWLEQKKINVLFQMGLHKASDLPDVPLAVDFARNDEERRILETAFLSYEFGRPYMTTPAIPAERLVALRKAFMDTMADASFVADAAKAQLDVNPLSPERLAELVKRTYELPPSLVARINALQKPNGAVETVQFKTVRAKLGEPGGKGRFPIELLDSGRKETVLARKGDSKVAIAGKPAEIPALKAGMTCAISYLGDGTMAASISCD
jgi:tripartite-type tricarboxylate transporter receptor subunit TctC